MSSVTNDLEISRPNYELSAQIRERRGDRRVFLGFAAAGVALIGAGVVGAYSLISGDYIPVLSEAIPGAGTFTTGVVLGIPGVGGSIKTNRDLRNLRQQEQQGLVTATEHYQQHEGFYQEEAVKDATAAGVNVSGWHPEN